MIKRILKRLWSRIDSLDFLRMARDLEEQLDVLLEDKALAGASAVADLVEVCCAAMSAQAAGRNIRRGQRNALARRFSGGIARR